jgi:hypothetical protein
MAGETGIVSPGDGVVRGRPAGLGISRLDAGDAPAL